MECIKWEGTPHRGLCRCSWNDDRLFDYLAHENCRARPAPLCLGCNTEISVAVSSAISRVALRDYGTGASPPGIQGTTILHRHARPYLVKTRPSDVRGLCSLMIWDERRRCNVGGRVGSVFQTAAWGCLQFVLRSEVSLDQQASRLSGYCKFLISLRIVSYQLRMGYVYTYRASTRCQRRRTPPFRITLLESGCG